MTKAVRVSDEIKKIVFDDPAKLPIVIYDELLERGVRTKMSTIESYRSDFLASLQVLRDLGALGGKTPAPIVPVKAKKVKQQSRPERWAAACSKALEGLEGLEDLKSLQEEYEEWKDNLPENLASSPVGEKLEEVCGLDLESAVDTVGEAEGLDLPRGFGKD